MIRTVLLTGTRAPATLDLARRLWREGVRVIGADSMRFPLGRFSKAFASHHRVPPPRQECAGFLRAVEAIARRESVDLIWPTCEEVFHIAAGRAALAAVASVFCPSLEVLERLHHKRRFAEWTRTLGGPITAPESWDARAAPRDKRLIWKPDYSRFAARTRLAAPGDIAGWMAQRFVEGRELCSWALCVNGEVRVLTQYVCPARSGRGAGCAFEPTWSDAVQEFTAVVARALNFTGALAFDFIEAATGTFVLECNPRMTSGLHVLVPEVSIRGLLACGGIALPPPQRAAQLLLPVLASSPRLAGSSPDVLACADDPAPAWAQGLAVAEFLCRSFTQRVSVLAATTLDIEYNGC
ncbi:MAG: hypothetical protein K8R23_02610 [Chthoniobacter sp.]|nr:hypothetical protein [Chthoniobacter sp.]